MSRSFFQLANLKILLVGLVFLLVMPVLAACGESTQAPATSQPTAPVATPTSNPSPTVAPTTATAKPVVIIPPATVTPLGNQGPTTKPVATIPPVPTGPVVTAPATTQVENGPANPPQPTDKVNPAPPTTPKNGTAATAGPAPSPTLQPSSPPNVSQPGSGAIFYLKDRGLMVNMPGEKSSREVAAKVFSYVQDKAGRVVFLQQSGDGPIHTLQLKMVSLSNGQLQESLLDTRLFETLPAEQQTNLPGGLYGVDTRAIGEMAISPDGSQVAYTKANLGGPTFEGMSTGEKPTELWLATLDPSNPLPHQLVPNDKDYIAKPLWSPDGNRIAFIRTSAFGTGAGYATALWSVYRNGSRLAFLTGPDLGKVDGTNFSATPAFNLRWVGTQMLGFQASNQIKFPIFLHDLTLGLDFPAAIATDAATEAVYCDGIQRYVYLKQDANGQPQPGAYSIGISNPANQTGPVDKEAIELYDCVGNSLLYRSQKGQVVLARLNSNGTVAGSKGLAIEQGSDVQVKAKLAPGGKLAAVQAGRITQVLAESGQITELKTGSLKYDTLTLEWASDRTLVGLAFTPSQPGQILAANLAGEQVFKVVDEGNSFSFAGPEKTAKAGL